MNVPTAIGLAKQGQVEKQGTENFCSCHTVGGWLRNISVYILAPDLLLRYMWDYERGMNFRVTGSGKNTADFAGVVKSSALFTSDCNLSIWTLE